MQKMEVGKMAARGTIGNLNLRVKIREVLPSALK
jgi:hypothetical protein